MIHTKEITTADGRHYELSRLGDRCQVRESHPGEWTPWLEISLYDYGRLLAGASVVVGWEEQVSDLPLIWL